MHMARHRSKPIQCEICQKVLPNKHSYNNHMIYTHGNRTYACHVCGKEYKKRFRLKVTTILILRNKKQKTKNKIFYCRNM